MIVKGSRVVVFNPKNPYNRGVEGIVKRIRHGYEDTVELCITKDPKGHSERIGKAEVFGLSRVRLIVEFRYKDWIKRIERGEL